jgi:predicted TIM-barrel fold metal-dependent hydrolase
MTIDFDSITGMTGERVVRSDRVTFLPEPEPQRRRYTIISVDDHVVEPPHMFEGRMPARFAASAPRVVERDGAHMWEFDERVIPNIGLNAVVGRPIEEQAIAPVRFEEMRRGTMDPAARVHDMDLNGIYGSLNFPSMLPGFCGHRLSMTKDPELGRAAIRAWNDWYLEEWVQAYPERFIAVHLPWLTDPEIAADEIRANAARGFKAVAFCESPDKLGLPSIYSGYWDPFLRACEETGTVVTLHVGSSGQTPTSIDDAPLLVAGILVPMAAFFAGIDWLMAEVALRFPEIKIVLSEGGLGWVPMLLDRLDYIPGHYNDETLRRWTERDITMSEVFKRNFYFCALDDRTTIHGCRERIGVDHIMIETDYPHQDSTWPRSQDFFAEILDPLPDEDAHRIAWKNASELFDHPVSAAWHASIEPMGRTRHDD